MSPRDRSFNLPNALTVLRIFLVPLLVVVLLTRIEGHVYFGAGIFALAVLTVRPPGPWPKEPCA